MKHCACALFLLILAGRAASAEPAVRDGLVFWFDASAQVSARQSASLPSIGRLQPVDIFLDSSVSRATSIQLAQERRPIFFTDGPTAYVKFDGKDDFLAFNGARQPVA